jgi:hypothetical protein
MGNSITGAVNRPKSFRGKSLDLKPGSIQAADGALKMSVRNLANASVVASCLREFRTISDLHLEETIDLIPASM